MLDGLAHLTWGPPVGLREERSSPEGNWGWSHTNVYASDGARQVWVEKALSAQ